MTSVISEKIIFTMTIRPPLGPLNMPSLCTVAMIRPLLNAFTLMKYLLSK